MIIVQRFVLDNSDEILNVKVTVRNDPSWAKVELSHPQVTKRANFLRNRWRAILSSSGIFSQD